LWYALYVTASARPRKIGMNCNQSLKILFTFDSSRFSGQTSRIYRGIPKKDISMLSKRFLSPITLKRSVRVSS